MAQKNHAFTYSARQRWAFLPTIAFLIVVALILWLRPRLIFTHGFNPAARNAAIALAALFAVWLGAAVLDRWLQPFSVALEADAIALRPLLGAERRIPYEQIAGVVERPATFFRHARELEIRLASSGRVLIRGDIGDYAGLVRTLRHRVPRSVAAGWVEPPPSPSRARR
ncbi:MAG TPA: hypothetical protein VET26_06660 [Candidatus Sulfotelmatobacter sp.]|nr:hypothetical protein [Candidatus Sulfotelmatobacter sp.]